MDSTIDSYPYIYGSTRLIIMLPDWTKDGGTKTLKSILASDEMRKKGYGLLCIAKATKPLELETQDEDEVYEIQFGKYLGEIKSNAGNPFEI